MSKCKKPILLFILVPLWLCCIQCRSMNNNLVVTVNKVTLLDSIPSGSGLAMDRDSLYIISDNTPYFYKLSLATGKFRKVPIAGYTAEEHLLPKKTKHDFESALTARIQGKNCLLAFGSGSSPRREKLLLAGVDNDNEQRIVPLFYLYSALRERYQLSKEALNIEGAALCNERLFLFLRKKNLVISMDWRDFEAYLLAPSEKNIPKTESQHIQLPKHAGIIAGFSGVTEVNNSKLVFCASLEHAPNHIDDGPIYGSYIGTIQVKKDGKLHLDDITLLQDNKGATIREKIESVVVTGVNGTSLTVILVSDNDSGASKLFEVTIDKKS